MKNNLKSRIYLLLCIIIVFTNCSSNEPQSKTAPATASKKEPPPAYRDSYMSSIAARKYLYCGESPKQGLGAYGYLIFTKRPNKEQLSRYRSVYDSYNRTMESINEYSDKPLHLIMVTYWMLKKRPDEVSPSSERAEYVESYDYAKAHEMAGFIKKSSVSGPILVAWKKPYGNDLTPSPSNCLVLDMSDFLDEEFDRAFEIWKDRIVRDENIWQDNFNLIKAREAFRNLIQRYGANIVAVIKGKQI